MRKLLPLLLGLLAVPLAAQESRLVLGVNRDGTLDVPGPFDIRLAGVVLPAPFGGDRRVEFFELESRAALADLLVGRQVRVELLEGGYWIDPNPPALVRLEGLLVNAWLLEEGYGRFDRFFAHPLARSFRELEAAARSERRGLWVSPFSAESYRY